jgi:hypothetical protein
MPKGVFLFEREAARKRTEPLADAREGSAAISRGLFTGKAFDQFASTPGDGAVRFVDDAESDLQVKVSDSLLRRLGGATQDSSLW